MENITSQILLTITDRNSKMRISEYIEEHPDFLNDYPVSYEHRELLQDELYRKLLRRIRAYETGEKAEKKE